MLLFPRHGINGVFNMNQLSVKNTELKRNNPVYVYLAGLLEESSQQTMYQSLAPIAQLLAPGIPPDRVQWEMIRFQEIDLIRSQLAKSYKPATVNRMLAALRGVMKACLRLRLIDIDDYSSLEIKNVKGTTLPPGRVLSHEELEKLIYQNDHRTKEIRDSAICGILYITGMRRQELVNLTVDDYQDNSLQIIRGKGRKDRIVYINDEIDLLIQRWLKVRSNKPGPLFLGVNKGGKIVPGKLTTQTVYHLLKDRQDKAGIKHLSPHDLRRTCITHLLEAKVNLSTVSEIAGHAQIQTTMRYNRESELSKQNAVNQLKIKV